MNPNTTVVIYTPQEFNHASYIHTGLLELEGIGVLKVKLKIDLKKRLGVTCVNEKTVTQHRNRAHPKTSYYKIINNVTKEELFVAFDLYDLANNFSSFALQNCKYIFKRNYELKYVERLSQEQGIKVNKFGLTFPLFPEVYKNEEITVLGLILQSIRLNFKLDSRVVSRLLNGLSVQLKEWNYVKSSRPLSSFDNYKRPESNTILFQTRCFPHENDEDVRAIHKQRYELITFLKRTFPNNFKGGFVPSKIAEAKYADALTNVPTEQELYLQAVKASKIVIYTRGLSNSPAWKLAEYLSQGKVIIAEALTAELPVPLRHNHELLYFKTLEDLKSIINTVLNDEDKLLSLSQHARAYYEKEIQPAKRMEYIINTISKK